jgi:lysozyme family protein
LKIYRKQFWGVIKGDQLPHNVAKAIMSMALTDGPQDSIRFVQKLLNVEQTGFMGPKTLTAIWSKCKKDDKMFTKQILDAQIKRYKSDEQADTYGKGWTNRADLVAENID